MSLSLELALMRD